MKVLDFDYSNNDGFVWITVEGRDEFETMDIQACINDHTLDTNDMGEDWGVCGDVNEEAFNYWGYSRCINALIRHARLCEELTVI